MCDGSDLPATLADVQRELNLLRTALRGDFEDELRFQLSRQPTARKRTWLGRSSAAPPETSSPITLQVPILLGRTASDSSRASSKQGGSQMLDLHWYDYGNTSVKS
eukprot:TRINITY_DN35622_c0_g1_i3.p1 TRINITY_DN35622_c0_g1~~TRINITY_DN35622_c0_g1_i3.p1  ORF type:complete len:106 (+),score=16.30 TRINITY_DN35622_c0_g1_i3:82-399(+)